MNTVSLRRNVIANLLGQAWTGVVGIAFLPLYIEYLGVEAYGLIGIYTFMQAWMTLLDMGMTPTLNREMALYGAGHHSPDSIRNLLRTIEIICYTLAALIALCLWLLASRIATGWIRYEQLSTETVVQALSVMAFVFSLRFCEGIYRGSLLGLQRQVWFNGANACLSTLRHGGVVGVLAWVSPTIEAFFIWQAGISLLALVVLASKVHKTLPRPSMPARFSTASLQGIWQFAGGMMGITFLSLLLTQIDKVLLSRMLLLQEFGYYALAATVAAVISMAVSPITQAFYPRMVNLSANSDQPGLASLYHQGAQLITILTVPTVILLGFFPGAVIFVWSGSAELVKNVAPVLSILAAGAFFNALMHMPYQLQLSYGWVALTLKINVLAACVIIPAIFWAVPRYGAIGAAWVWVALNVIYIVVGVHFMHRRILAREKWHWYFNDVILPVGGAVACAMIAQRFQPSAYEDRLHWLYFIVALGTAVFLVSSLLSNQVRGRAFQFFKDRTQLR